VRCGIRFPHVSLGALCFTWSMSRANILIVLGLLTALAPFSGLPSSWLQWLLPIAGIAIAATGHTYKVHVPVEQGEESVVVTG
jgi:hypothetical protein